MTADLQHETAQYKRTSARRSSPSVVNQQRTTQELVMSDRKLILTMDKILHSFSPSYLLRDTIICVNNVIPGTNLSVKLDMHFVHSTTRGIQIYFHKFQKKIQSTVC